MDTLERFLLVATGDEMVGSLDSQTHGVQVRFTYTLQLIDTVGLVKSPEERSQRLDLRAGKIENVTIQQRLYSDRSAAIYDSLISFMFYGSSSSKTAAAAAGL